MCGNLQLIMKATNESLKTVIADKISVYESSRPCVLSSVEPKYSKEGDLVYAVLSYVITGTSETIKKVLFADSVSDVESIKWAKLALTDGDVLLDRNEQLYKKVNTEGSVESLAIQAITNKIAYSYRFSCRGAVFVYIHRLNSEAGGGFIPYRERNMKSEWVDGVGLHISKEYVANPYKSVTARSVDQWDEEDMLRYMYDVCIAIDSKSDMLKPVSLEQFNSDFAKIKLFGVRKAGKIYDNVE